MNTFTIFRELETVMDSSAASKIADIIGRVHEDLQNTVTKKEFRLLVDDTRELKGIVKELAEAQKRTEQKVEELAEAQKRTEQKVAELAEAQKRTEQKVEKLAEAQKLTDRKVDTLSIKLENLTDIVTRLAISHEKLTASHEKLVEEHQKTRQLLGNISDTVGYTLENEAYKFLPMLLEHDFGIILNTDIKRQYVMDNKGKSLEVNIFAEGEQNGQTIVIIGESKSRLSKNNVDRFIRKRLKRYEGMFPKIFPVVVGHITSSADVEDYIKEKDIAVYYSYQFR